jgi:myxalamid-type polyketide synthase MxaE and MxaD
MHPMPTSAALDALGNLIASEESQATVAWIDWTVLKAVYAARRPRPLLDLVSNREPARMKVSPAAESRTSLKDLTGLPEFDRMERIVETIRADAAAVLGLRVDEVDIQKGLFEMGMDSLMSVELKTRLEQHFERTLPATLTFNYPSVRALAGFLGGQPAPSVPAAAEAKTSTAVIATDPDLSEDDLADMLADAIKGVS